MVRTMGSTTPGPPGSQIQIRGLENGLQIENDDLTSDFSIIAHPSEDTGPLPPQSQNLDYLNHLQFSAIQQPPSMGPVSMNSMDEIKQQLRDIVTENQELKAALEQNSGMLKNSFETIVNYQDKYIKAMNRQKESIKNMTKIREDLQEEKDALQAALDENKELVNTLTQEKETAQKELERVAKLLSQAELEVLTMKPELDRQQIQCMHLEESVKELQTEKQQLESEVRTLRLMRPASQSHRVPLVVTDEDNGYTVVHNGGMSYVCDEVALMKQNLEAMSEEKKLFVNLLKEEQEQTKQLQAELAFKDEKLRKYEETERKQLSSWVCPTIAAPPDTKFPLMEEELVNKSISTVNDTNLELEKCQERFSSINQQLSECQDRIMANMKDYGKVPDDVQNLIDEITMLRTIVKDEQDTKESYKIQLEECQLKFQKEYESLVRQWESYKSDVKTQGRHMEALSEIEKRTNQEKLDEFVAKVMDLEEKLQEKEGELKRMKNQLEMIQRETEQIPILRSRNELYQIKLQQLEEAQRESDKLLESKNKEIMSLGIQVSQLLDELNAHSGQQLIAMSGKDYDKLTTSKSEHKRQSKSKACPVHKNGKKSLERSGELLGAVGGESYKSTSAMQQLKPAETVNNCPRCNLAFTGFHALNNHVQECCFNDMNGGFL